MTIEQAFEKSETININYIHQSWCKQCHKWHDLDDEEYGFYGTRDEFIERYTRNYPHVLELDDEVEEIGENDYNYIRTHYDDFICEECENSEKYLE